MSGTSCRAIFGRSIQSKNSVLSDFFTLFPATLELAFCAMVFAIAIGIPAGVLAAERRGSVYDHALMGAALTGYSMPIFWWGLLLILFFSLNLGWTPVSGRIDLDYYFEDGTGFMLYDALVSDQEGAFTSAVMHLILPTIVLGTIPARGDRADDPLRHARSAGRGLRASRRARRV